MTLAIVLGISLGLNYGASNQLYYLLPSLAEANPGILTRDWLVTETKHYHPAFGVLGTWLIRADPSGWLVALASVVVIAFVGIFLARLARTFDSRGWFVATLLVLASCVVSRTMGPGGTYVISRTFQPSALGALGLVVGAFFFTTRRYWKCGVALGIGGAFHANYLLLGILSFGLAGVFDTIAEERRPAFRTFCLGAWRNLTPTLVPSLVVLVWMLPMIMESSSGPDADLVQRIYQDVRGPHHYVVAQFWRDFVPWLGWQALGAGALFEMQVPWGNRARRMQRMLLAILVIVSVCVLFSSVVRVRSINHLFAWRLAPVGVLLAQVAFFTAVSSRPRPWFQNRHAIKLQAVGFLLLGIGALLLRDPWPVGFACAGLVIGGIRHFLTERQVRCAGVPAALALALFIGVVAAPLSRLEKRSNLLREQPKGLGALCKWVARKTPTEAIFLIPPDFHEFRFHCRRAVVVDWKADPLLPKDFMEWLRRMQDVTGRSRVDVRGFYSLDTKHLRKVAKRYDADYIITRPRKHRPPIKAPRLFSNKHFEVYQVPSK